MCLLEKMLIAIFLPVIVASCEQFFFSNITNTFLSLAWQKLCDSDPGVMGATLCPLFDLITVDVKSYKDLVVSFVSILKQVAERRLPKSYDYHQMPAPFIQIKLLKILGLLGNGDKHASEQMYTVLGDLMRKCDTSTNIGNAILYECICCISSIYPNPKLLEAAAEVISKFLKSDNHNLKYMGIDALGRLIKLSPDVAEQHQLAVIDCLEDPDDTLKRKTFELLQKMTKSSNVEVIVDRMIDYMISINDFHYKTEIASRCVELAEQFAPSNHWFILTMNKVFEHAGDLVNIKVAHNLMRLIAEGFGEDDDTADSQLRSSAVESYLRIVTEPKLPSAFLQVICWVLGEYGTADRKYSASYITGKLCDIAEAYSSDETVKAYAITSLMKIYAVEIAAGRRLDILPECQSLIEELAASHSTDLQQRAYELQAVVGLDAHAVESIMPSDASCEDIEINALLPFLDSYVQQSLQNGAQPYIPEDERSGAIGISNFSNQGLSESSTHGLKFEAYEMPKPPVPSRPPHPVSHVSSELVPVPEPSYSRETQFSPPNLPVSSSSAELKLRLDGVQKKWGKPSYSSTQSSSSGYSSSAANGASQLESAAPSTSQPRESYKDLKKVEVEISSEKQKLAASLFGGSMKSEKRTSTSHRASKGSNHSTEKSSVLKSSAASIDETKIPQLLPDLLDLGESAPPSTVAASVDPFMQLEGLLDQKEIISSGSSAVIDSSNRVPDIVSLYSELHVGGQSSQTTLSPLSSNGSDSINLKRTVSGGSAQATKGPNLKEALEKDSLVRQMGVNPTTRNPNLFKDLLG
ncbi:hypothetical protein SAY86_027385 [Trapa natans]|uniref:AP-4 complex subunit epsilon n=1 Tax=Trapa natans TaxID=22666 RepID=A0AAN7QM44_TRANT|nr:hypothetical protein SAY86_027385 [Trapa natans]